MGPSKYFHKNRSSHSLLNSHDVEDKGRFQPSPADSPLHSPAFPPSQYGQEEEDEDTELDPHYRNQYHPEEARYYQSAYPVRSQSTRNPSHLNTNVSQPTINLVGPAHSTPSSTIDEGAPDSFYRQGPAPNPPAHKEERKKRRFFGLGSSKEPTSSPASSKLGRSISVRRRDQPPENYQENVRHAPQQDWPSTHTSPAEEYDEDPEDRAGLYPPPYPTGPPRPDKEPLRSPGLPPSISHQDYSQAKTNTSPTQSRRGQSDRQGSYESSWTRASSNIHHHTHSEPPQQQPQTAYHVSPSSATSTVSGQHFSHQPPRNTLQQPWQEEIPSRPSSQQSLEPPPSAQSTRTYDAQHTKGRSSETSSLSHYTQSSMGPPAPPPPPQAPNRRPSEVAAPPQSGEQGREGGYQPYNQNIQDRAAMSSNAPQQYGTQLAPHQSYRNSQISSVGAQGHEQGRSTPPPSRSRDDLSTMDYPQLQTKHEELQDKYRKVKKYYFDKDAQVQQLQNTLAHQRLAQSRTSLDDNEYVNRFTRLDGAINNLAFNIRRDWRQIPPWLGAHCNRDATTNPTKEMTAVGRAAISRWLIDELLDRHFHPGLEPNLSSHLKIIEKNLRRFAPPTPTDEEREALMAKISNWRLSTLDGLQEFLAAPKATEYRTTLTESLVEKLVASLGMMLKEPMPPGIEGGVGMIVELAVGISANLPLESRDVFVDYVTPGQLITDTYMKVETGLPPLTNPGEAPEGETASMMSGSKQTEETGSIDSRETGNSNGEAGGAAGGEGHKESPQQQAQGAKKKSMFGNFMGSGGSKRGMLLGIPLRRLDRDKVRQAGRVDRRRGRRIGSDSRRSWQCKFGGRACWLRRRSM
ncbi:uncharacterized protein KY384_006581 [Bacidia gigantensis]|uniref:uncharacterized protein n=1 Tax=Bacidia gigantensis TaxID=2732470 RepID=UPI001D04D70E|nr:uncharacterized protein KY384_006581 [Bacidia gigantensis]KAG8528892.1 hypothetical protein KY384_006581 [Bacidia gigantensis]